MSYPQLTAIPKSSLDFLFALRENNNRDWFNTNKDVYLEQLTFIESFADLLLGQLQIHDLIETPSGKKSLQRIYKDTRFSTNKTPYKTNWSGRFTRATAQRRGGYYYHIEPGNSFIAGGFWSPDALDIRRIRDDISFDPAPLRKILGSESFVKTFGTLRGELLKTTPKGFHTSDDAIDLLRYKQYLLIRRFADDEVLAPDFLNEASLTFRSMRPFFDYMSEVLATDHDGLAI